MVIYHKSYVTIKDAINFKYDIEHLIFNYTRQKAPLWKDLPCGALVFKIGLCEIAKKKKKACKF